MPPHTSLAPPNIFWPAVLWHQKRNLPVGLPPLLLKLLLPPPPPPPPPPPLLLLPLLPPLPPLPPLLLFVRLASGSGLGSPPPQPTD